MGDHPPPRFAAHSPDSPPFRSNDAILYLLSLPACSTRDRSQGCMWNFGESIGPCSKAMSAVPHSFAHFQSLLSCVPPSPSAVDAPLVLIISLYGPQNTLKQARTWRHPPIPVWSWTHDRVLWFRTVGWENAGPPLITGFNERETAFNLRRPLP